MDTSFISKNPEATFLAKQPRKRLGRDAWWAAPSVSHFLKEDVFWLWRRHSVSPGPGRPELRGAVLRTSYTPRHVTRKRQHHCFVWLQKMSTGLIPKSLTPLLTTTSWDAVMGYMVMSGQYPCGYEMMTSSWPCVVVFATVRS